MKDLDGQAKGSAVKIALADMVKSRTVVTNLWIARRLQMGDSSRVSRYCAEDGSRCDVQRIAKRLKKAGSKNFSEKSGKCLSREYLRGVNDEGRNGSDG